MDTTTVIALLGIVLFLVAGTGSLLLSRKPLPTIGAAKRPQPRTVRPVPSQRPVAVAAPPEPAPRRRLSRRTYMMRTHRRMQRIRAAHSLELELMRARIVELEAALLEKLVLAEV